MPESRVDDTLRSKILDESGSGVEKTRIDGDSVDTSTAELDAWQQLVDAVQRFGLSFESSAKRMELVLYPTVFVLIILLGYGFFLLYSHTQDMHVLARNLDPDMSMHMSQIADHFAVISVSFQLMEEEFEQMVSANLMVSEDLESMARNLSVLEPLLVNVSHLNMAAANLGRDLGMERMHAELTRHLARPREEADPAGLVRAMLIVTRARYGEMNLWFIREAVFLSELLEMAGYDSTPVWRAVSDSVDRFLAKKGAQLVEDADLTKGIQTPLIWEFVSVLSAYDCLQWLKSVENEEELDEQRRKFREFLLKTEETAGSGTQLQLLARDSISVMGQLRKASPQGAPVGTEYPAAPGAANNNQANEKPNKPISRKQTLMMSSCGFGEGRSAFVMPALPTTESAARTQLAPTD